jgi:hypothetical protein
MTDERRIIQGSSHELIVQHERPGCHAPAHTTPHGRIFHVFPSQKEQKEKEQKIREKKESGGIRLGAVN